MVLPYATVEVAHNSSRQRAAVIIAQQAQDIGERVIGSEDSKKNNSSDLTTSMLFEAENVKLACSSLCLSR